MLDVIFCAALAVTGAACATTSLGLPTARAIEPIRRIGGREVQIQPGRLQLPRSAHGQTAQGHARGFSCRLREDAARRDRADVVLLSQGSHERYLRHLKQLAFDLGLDISGTAVGNDFCVPPGPKRDEQIADVKRWIERAEVLGAPVIRIFSGHAQQGTSVDEAHKLAVAGIEESCQYAGEHGVYLALENHGGLTATADGLLKLVRDVKSPWFGVNLDTGNFNTPDPYGDLARLAPYAINVQVKISMQPAGGKRQPADMKRLAQILTESGYRGYIVLEFEEPTDPLVECPRYINEMRRAFLG